MHYSHINTDQATAIPGVMGCPSDCFCQLRFLLLIPKDATLPAPCSACSPAQAEPLQAQQLLTHDDEEIARAVHADEESMVAEELERAIAEASSELVVVMTMRTLMRTMRICTSMCTPHATYQHSLLLAATRCYSLLTRLTARWRQRRYDGARPR